MHGILKNFPVTSIIKGRNKPDDRTNGLLWPFSNINLVLQYACFALLLFGIKLSIIHFYGNATPFWDQWDAEAAGLYKPFIDGTLTWKHLLALHNEHRIFFTRALALTLLVINKSWNPLLQMVVNAGLHTATLLFLNVLLSRFLGRQTVPALLCFSLIVFCIPYGWENVLAGFQSQFYFVVLFSIVSIWVLVTQKPFSGRWVLGGICGVFAFFSLASGVFAFAATSFVSMICYLTMRRTYRQLGATLVLFALFVSGALLTPSLPHQAVYKAHTFGEFYNALMIVLAWPISPSFAAALIRNLPMFFFIFLILRKRPQESNSGWFLFAFGIWSLSQVISIAYGRANAILAPRYKDLYAIPVYANFVCLISLLQIYINRYRRMSLFGLATWVAIVILALGIRSFKSLPNELATKRKTSLAQEENTRAYVESNDIGHLKGKPPLYVPLPDPERLASIIELPGIRDILPSNINRVLKVASMERRPDEAFVINGYYITTPKRLDTIWGSYSARGDKSMGQMSLQYNSNLKNAKIGIPVAGYPFNTGMRVEIQQNGQRSPLIINGNPGEAWDTGYATVTGDFSIHLIDSSMALGGWAAVGKPFVPVGERLVVGRFDRLTNSILSHYYVLIFAGIAILILLLTRYGLIPKGEMNLS